MKEYRKKVVSAVLAAAIAVSSLGVTAYADNDLSNLTETVAEKDLFDETPTDIDYSSEYYSVNGDITSNQIERAIAWALQWVGQSSFYDNSDGSGGYSVEAHFNCSQFVRTAWVDQSGAGLSYLPTSNARVWGNKWTKSTNLSEIPPRGALCFYDYYSGGTNYGHVGISLGDGRIVSALSTVCITEYRYGISNCTYTGWGTWNNMTLSNTPVSTVPKFDKTIENISQAQDALDLIYNQNENTVRAGRTKYQMIEYLLTGSKYAVFGGENWPVSVNGSASSITDPNLASIDGTTTIKLDSTSSSSMSFGWFASGVVYTEEISLQSQRCTKIQESQSAGNYTVDFIKSHFKQKLQAGEHLRVDELCSMTFVSCDDNGFYWLEYGSEDGSDAHIRMRYASYNTFVNWLNSTGRSMWHYYVDLTDNTTKSIISSSISAIGNQTYTSYEIKPEVIVTYNGRTLKQNKDYSISYSNNVNVGTASVTITGMGVFTDSKTAYFEIKPQFISSANIESIPSQTYTGSEITPSVVVSYEGKYLSNGVDYTLSYVNNVTPGTAIVNISGKGNFASIAAKEFLITPKNIDQCSINVDLSDKNYTGSEICPDVQIFDSERNCNLTNGIDFTVSYSDNTNAGTATIIINGIKCYTGSLSRTFTIIKYTPSAPSNVKAVAGDGQVTLSWNAVPNATSYTIYKYENNSFVRIAGVKTTSYKVTGLTNGTEYKFLVRAFNSAGGSAFSTADLVSATPKATATAPAKPTVSANVQDKVVTFSWNEVSGATYYKLYNYSNGNYGLIATVTDTTYRLRYLKNGTTYQVLVRAFNEKGGSKFTTADLITVTPKAATAVPDKPVVTATVSGGNVNLTWAHVPTAFSYSIYKYENGTYTKLGATCDNYFTVKGLTAGKTYSILVRAFNSAGGHKVTSSDRVSVTI